MAQVSVQSARGAARVLVLGKGFKRPSVLEATLIGRHRGGEEFIISIKDLIPGRSENRKHRRKRERRKSQKEKGAHEGIVSNSAYIVTSQNKAGFPDMATWLGLEAEDTGWTLTDSGGMRRILKNMDHASGCYPSLPLFIGQTTKVQALRSLYPYNNIRRYAKRNLARVYLSGRTGSYPVVLMEASLSGRGIKVRSPPPKQVEGVHRYRIHNSHNVSYGDIENLVYLRCLVPVCDVLCLFVADLGGIAHVQDILRSWGSSPLLSLDGSRRSRPRLLIVLTDPQDKLNEVDDMERTLTNTVVPNLAASVTTVDLRNRNQLSSVSRYEPLQRQLTLELDEARAARSKARLLFSAPHLDWILRRLFRCVAQRPTSPFNCIIACRERRDSWGIADNTTQYLTEFLDITNQAGVPVIPVVDFIASAFLMDAYPPGMHGTTLNYYPLGTSTNLSRI